MAQDLKVEVLSDEPVQFAGKAAGLEGFFSLRHRVVRIGERVDDRVYWSRGEFVLIVALTPERDVVLIREYKQAAEKVLLCVPAGKIKNDGETPAQAALRELQEETGYTALGYKVFGPFYNSPDKSTEKHHVVLIYGAKRAGGPAPEESETILGVQLCPAHKAKEKLLVGLHRMAVDVATDYMTGLRRK